MFKAILAALKPIGKALLKLVGRKALEAAPEALQTVKDGLKGKAK